jgi:hypothetical protein
LSKVNGHLDKLNTLDLVWSPVFAASEFQDEIHTKEIKASIKTWAERWTPMLEQIERKRSHLNTVGSPLRLDGCQ